MSRKLSKKERVGVYLSLFSYSSLTLTHFLFIKLTEKLGHLTNLTLEEALYIQKKREKGRKREKERKEEREREREGEKEREREKEKEMNGRAEALFLVKERGVCVTREREKNLKRKRKKVRRRKERGGKKKRKKKRIRKRLSK